MIDGRNLIKIYIENNFRMEDLVIKISELNYELEKAAYLGKFTIQIKYDDYKICNFIEHYIKSNDRDHTFYVEMRYDANSKCYFLHIDWSGCKRYTRIVDDFVIVPKIDYVPEKSVFAKAPPFPGSTDTYSNIRPWWYENTPKAVPCSCNDTKTVNEAWNPMYGKFGPVVGKNE